MKSLLLVLGVVVFGLGCKEKIKPVPVIAKAKVINYPRYVHDTCSGQWAVQTEADLFFGTVFNWELTGHGYPWPVSDYAIKYNGNTPPKDSVHAFIGWEFQYADSTSAKKAFTEYNNRHMRAKFIADSLSNIASHAAEIEKKRQDSIFKCQHSYQ